ncbi:peptidase domain-containing ABC transporter [Fulvivirga sp. M361]|uniref:peptidase domain-containing ABC transporter n=1 Tax=Fulvivirga sp. M361 TaxID=2594266 RepID=UPI001179F6A6|nr:peptidase domain-containing ABC transporter [Fulvivirga sp. M361]TRX54825.1 peptidase domain-containing ABC transporter [Fulvivirga sp. M361]
MKDKKERKNIGLKQSFRYFLRLTRLIRPYWSLLGKGIVLGPVIGLLAIITPFLSKLLFDSVYPTGSIALMEVIVVGILAITIASTFADIALGYYTSYISTKVGSVFNLHFLNHLQHLPSSFFVRHQVGEIKSRFTDGQSALNAIVNAVQVLFGQGIYLLIVPPFLFFLHWKLALVAILVIPVSGLITFLSGKYLRSSWKDVSEAHADFDALQVEMLNQVQTFKGLGLEHYNFKRGAAIQQKALKSHLRAHSINSALGISDRLLSALNMALFTWLGWKYIIQGEMSLGDYVAFTAYIGYMYGPFSNLVNLFTSFQHAAVNLNRVYEYLDAAPEQDPKLAYEPPPEIKLHLQGAITFNNVSFSYQRNRPILERISCKLESGKFYGLVGASGSGKTTLLRLLSRFEKPVEGSIYFDDVNSEHVPLIDFRRQIATVWQEVQLIKGTVWENLTLGLENPSLDEVNEIIKISHLDDLIRSFPEGYQTPISEWGSSLSGGQRQRFAIARALIRKPRILILDEATSNLDVNTEMGLINSLSMFISKYGITTIFVTHRVKNLIHSDEIFILKNGAVESKGSYTELMSQNEQFRDMISHADVPGPMANDMNTIYFK